MFSRRMLSADVLLVGGGIVGASVAYFLRALGFTGRIVLVERDFAFLWGSTRHSMGGIRRCFLSQVNVRLAQFGHEVYRDIDRYLPFDEGADAPPFRPVGYLLLADGRNWSVLHAMHSRLRTWGLVPEWVGREALPQLLGWEPEESIVGGLYCPGDGVLDVPRVHAALYRKLKELEVEAVQAEVERVLVEGGRLVGVEAVLVGERARVRWKVPRVVLAAGAWSPKLAAAAGEHLPVESRRRAVYSFAFERNEAAKSLPPLPFLLFPGGEMAVLRGEELLLSVPAGHAREEEAALAVLRRLGPYGHGTRLLSGRTAVHDVHVRDYSPIVGPCPRAEGLWVAAGFGTYGVGLAPAVGFGLAERILGRRRETLPLDFLTPSRIMRAAWVEEALLS
ncbi:MAG: FAD-binding oxidoreductase [Brockia lithotrophica]|nr:FAD-binding oxidoreductase [Brockia lithotrophica]